METLIRLLIPGLIFTINLFSQTIIEGKTITGGERWSGTIIIKGDVKVAKSGRLIIDPGCNVLFSAHTDLSRSGRDKTSSEIIIEGMFIARGTLEHKILFSSQSKDKRMSDWY